MERHFTYFMHWFPGEIGQSMEKLVCGLGLALFLIIIAFVATKKIRSGGKLESYIVPASKLSLFGLIDFILSGFVGFHDSLLGKENRKYLSFHACIFFFLLLSNLLGLIPGMPGATTTVWINVGIAIVVYVAFNIHGMQSQGVIGHLKHLCGPIPLLAFMIFPIEVVSNLLRIITLNLRIYWNINADHLVVGIFTDLVSYGVPVAFYFMGIIVCFMQAFVFTILSMIYTLEVIDHHD